MKKIKRRFYFSLVELMVVVVILGLLAGLAGVAVIQRVEEARIERTRSDIGTIERALKFFRLDTGKYPAALEELVQNSATLKGWKGPYLEKGLGSDAWGNSFIYTLNQDDKAKPVVIRSMGPDGVDGNNDDISNYDSIDGGDGSGGGAGGVSLDSVSN